MITLPKTPSFRLDGRRALITGASRGIGLAGATALAEAGAHVVLTARGRDELDAVTSAMHHAGYSAEANAVDVSDIHAVRELVANQAPFDILFNNAGLNRPTPMTEITEDDFDAVMTVNVRGAYFVAQTIVKRMIDAGIKGSVIHTSSQMGLIGGPDRTVYCASKHAIEGLTKAMAIELGPHGIRVNTLCPTFIRTPLAEKTLADPARKAWVESKIKLGRIGEVEDLMGAVLFLASDAASLITGTSLVVDGGWTAG